MLTVEITGDPVQGALVEVELDRLHLVAVDPAPDRMAVAATFLLMEDNGARLAF